MTSPAAPPPDADRPKYWFPAKQYGWGWGWPCTWRGWAVLAGYLVLLSVAVRIFPPERTLLGFLASVSGLSAVLLAIC